MPKEEWGTKRLCPQCNTRFYDLNNDPMTCPACGATSVVDEEALLDGEPVCPARGKPLDFEVTEE